MKESIEWFQEGLFVDAETLAEAKDFAKGTRDGYRVHLDSGLNKRSCELAQILERFTSPVSVVAMPDATCATDGNAKHSPSWRATGSSSSLPCRPAMPDRTLFGGHRIERLAGVIDGPPVPVENGSEARWARDATGRQWVRKRESDTGFQPLLAEAASFLLGEHLRVPQPRGAVFHDGVEWSWMSERIVAAGEHWEPDMRDLVVNLDELGRVLTLDAIVFNEDRHRRNLLVEPIGDEAHLKVWAIDAGKAEIGWPEDYAGRGLSTPSPHNHARGLPVDALFEPALAAAEVAASLSKEVLRALVDEACFLAREPAAPALADALAARCRRARDIVFRYLEDLGGLR